MKCIILAAGMSKRLGQPKQLLRINDRTLLDIMITEALKAELDIIVVTGHEREKIESIASAYPAVRTIYNPRYQEGQITSSQAGLSLIDNEDYFITPCDLPLIRAEHYRLIMAIKGSHQVVRPFCDGVPGHPVLMGRETISPVMEIPPQQGIKSIINDFDVLDHESHDRAFITDVDTMDSYLKLISPDSTVR